MHVFNIQEFENYLVRDALVSGLRSDYIRASLLELEDSKDNIDSCISLACAIDLSSDFSKAFRSAKSSIVAAAKPLFQTTLRHPDCLGTSLRCPTGLEQASFALLVLRSKTAPTHLMNSSRLPLFCVVLSCRLPIFTGSNEKFQAMVDTGSTGSFISASTAAKDSRRSEREAR